MTDWGVLARDLNRTMSAHAPGWTDRNDADPGITILEVVAFLSESLLHRGVVEGGASTAARTIHALDPYVDQEASVVHMEACVMLSECWSGKTRPRFFSGRILTADDLQQEQEYHLAQHRHHLRTSHGSGVVDGLHVSVEPGGTAISVQPGFAIDGEGREILVCERINLPIPPNTSSPAWIAVEYAERLVDPVPIAPEGTKPSRVEEGGNIVLASAAPTGGVAIARLLLEQDGWRVDAAFVPTRPRM